MVTDRAHAAAAACVLIAITLPWTLQVAAAGGTTPLAGAPFAPHRLLLGFEPGTDAGTQQRVVDGMGGRIVGSVPALDLVIVAVERLDRALAMAEGSTTVAYSEPDFTARIMDGPAARSMWRAYVPVAWSADDPRAGEQWHHSLIHTPEAWHQTRGSGVVIAIVDTGVDCTLGDLASQCLAGYDFANEDADAADDHGHGTDVASLAAAAARNGYGGAGVAPDARVLPVKVMGASGYGSHAAIAAGVVWAVDQGARVVNLSLGGYYDSATLRAAIQYALERGAVVVAAAGNDDVAMPTYPAAYPGVIGVAATDRSDAHWQPSNHGDYVDVSAPGAGVATASQRGWSSTSGTSQATPIVAGVAALVLSQDPNRTPAAVEQRILAGAIDLGASGWDPLFGHGRVDAAGAVAP